MSYIGFPYSIDQIYGQTFQYELLTGDGSTTAFTFTGFFVSAASVFVFINGVQQNPVNAYNITPNNVSGSNTLTFTSAPFSGDQIVVRYKI
tara:strand:- start:1069 stop:1341 length:273 start_codon:yes stop_codon:yes gene_type:complete